MSVPGQRRAPLAERNDGLSKIKCPYCNWPWYRMQPAEVLNLHEIKCRGCKRIILYRLHGNYVEDLTATQL